MASLPAADSAAALFSADFYLPYAAAAQTALSALCAARRLLVLDTGEDVVAFTYRLKSPASIRGKLLLRGLPVSEEAAHAALHDVAGLRVVLRSVSQVYRFAELLARSPLLQLADERDYISAPKRSGSRSLHLLFTVPAPPGTQGAAVPVEIQLRTAAMDIWASIEHRLIYKPAGASV